MAPTDGDGPRDELIEVDTRTAEERAAGVGAPANVEPSIDDHPFGGDTHPMHDWDDTTKADVHTWQNAVIDDLAERAETARLAVVDLEERIERGDPVKIAERVAVHAEFQAAALEHEHAVGQLRTLQHRTPASFDQELRVVNGQGQLVAVPDGWAKNEESRTAAIGELRDAAAMARVEAASFDPDNDQYVVREPGGTMPAAQNGEATE